MNWYYEDYETVLDKEVMEELEYQRKEYLEKLRKKYEKYAKNY